VRVIFIASLSHSGSTLLDLMLNAHPQMVSVGELKQLARFARLEKIGRHRRCTCGARTVHECEFWNRVGAIIEADTGQSLEDLNVENYRDEASFARDNVTLFKAIAEATGKEYIVDSSKHPARLMLLLRNPIIDVLPIFLLRSPKGQICSAQKRPTSLTTLIGTYVRTNRKIYSAVKDRPHAVVHYEQLVQQPEATLALLMRGLGLSFDPLQLQWAAPVRHNVGGNGMRRGTSSELKLDERWRDHFGLGEKVAIDIGTFPGRYPFLKLGLLRIMGGRMSGARCN
jgi:hypothetical protein